jgi:nitrate reductase beta subunit
MAGCSLTGDGGPGMYESDPVPVSVETFHTLKRRGSPEQDPGNGRRSTRVNLLNWDGGQVPAGMFPEGRQ